MCVCVATSTVPARVKALLLPRLGYLKWIHKGKFIAPKNTYQSCSRPGQARGGSLGRLTMPSSSDSGLAAQGLLRVKRYRLRTYAHSRLTVARTAGASVYCHCPC